MRKPHVLRIALPFALHVLLGALAFAQFSFWAPNQGIRVILALLASFPLNIFALLTLPFLNSAVAGNLDLTQIGLFLWLANLGVVYLLARHGLPVQIEKYVGISASLLVFRWSAYGWGVAAGLLVGTSVYWGAFNMVGLAMPVYGLSVYLIAMVCFIASATVGVLVARTLGAWLVKARSNV